MRARFTASWQSSTDSVTRHPHALAVPDSGTEPSAAAPLGDLRAILGSGTPETAPAVDILARRARLHLVPSADTTVEQDAASAPALAPAARARAPQGERWSGGMIAAMAASLAAPWVAALLVQRTLDGGTGLLLIAATLASGIAVLLVRDARATRKHRRLEREYALFFELSPDPLCVFTLDGAMVRANRACGGYLGHAPDALLGTTWFDTVHPQDATGAHLAWTRLLEAGETVSLEARVRGDSEVWLQWHLAVWQAQGVVFAVARDVTARHQQEDELRHHRDVAEAASRELESFSYSVSHDLRRPLRAIDGFGAALAEECAAQLGETGLDYLARIRRNARRASELIDDLLQLSRIARCDLREEDVDLSRTAHEILDDLRRADPVRMVEVHVEPGLAVRGDRRLLRIVLENLLGNAWKFSRERAPATIAVVRAATSRGTALCVRDNGAGFDMAYADKLFGAFQRLHREEQFEGTGVGLATVHRVVRRHGGDVWAEGAVGHGAAVYVRLPFAEPAAPVPDGRSGDL